MGYIYDVGCFEHQTYIACVRFVSDPLIYSFKREDEADAKLYHFVGYATVYPFFCWPDKVRMRIRFVGSYSWISLMILSLNPSIHLANS